MDNRQGLAFVFRSLASGAGLLAVGQWVITNGVGWLWAGLAVVFLLAGRWLAGR